MKIALGADHGGYALKRMFHVHLKQQGYSVLNCGTSSPAQTDYPDHAEKVALAVAQGRAQRGIMICGSGVGACIAANKVPGARAAVCHDTFSARQGVEDDDMNVLCLGARVIGPQLALEILNAWIRARFSKAERHRRRLGKVLALEAKFSLRNGEPANVRVIPTIPTGKLTLGSHLGRIRRRVRSLRPSKKL